MTETTTPEFQQAHHPHTGRVHLVAGSSPTATLCGTEIKPWLPWALRPGTDAECGACKRIAKAAR